MADLELLGRAREFLASARRLFGQGEVSGVAGLAFQALDLAAKELTDAIDGADPGSHQARMKRLQALIQADQEELGFLWNVRQRDFYGDASAGEPRDLPTRPEARRALAIAGRNIEKIARMLRPPPKPRRR
ncbi:MAG: HEPN domain-containing protein [Dehalococcoidia bacterium]